MELSISPQYVCAIVFVSFIWGITNPFIKSAADNNEHDNGSFVHFLIGRGFLIPFAINQLASVLFTLLLAKVPVTVAVPSVNALTFLFTSLCGQYVCREPTDNSVRRWCGMFLVLLGVYLCMVYE